MNRTLSRELQHAQQLAATARVMAVVALVVIAISIVTQGGIPVGAAIFDNATPWRDRLDVVAPALVALLPAFLFYASVNELHRALKLYSEGEFFSAAAASRVAQAGDYAISAMVALMLIVPNLTLWITKRGGFDVRIESGFIGMLAFALFISVVGRILSAATELKTENDSFV